MAESTTEQHSTHGVRPVPGPVEWPPVSWTPLEVVGPLGAERQGVDVLSPAVWGGPHGQ